MSTATLSATDYEAVIGLEVHVQLKTNTKMFFSLLNSIRERSGLESTMHLVNISRQ